MEKQNLTIDNLLKVTVHIEAGTSRERYDLLAEPETFEFIYGVAACGITPFEKLLYQKTAGDELTTVADLANSGEFFGPLASDLPAPLLGRGETFFKIKIDAVQTPADSEVVKALASGGGCGGDCGCGCG